MVDINKCIERSKNVIRNTYLKIEQKGDSYIIKQYHGPIKSQYTMYKNGWAIFLNLIDEISESYPIFNINDFKAINSHTIQKKTDEDYIKKEAETYVSYIKSSQKLYEGLKNLKELFNALSVNFLNYSSFLEIQKLFINASNSQNGQKYLNLFTLYTNEIYLGFEELNIPSSRKLFNEKFDFFLALIK